MPGPLSVTVTRKRVAWLAGGGASPSLGATSSVTTTSGRMPASSAASSALSTASLTQVRKAFRGLAKPSRCWFLVKSSETEMSRWRAPISTADTDGFGSAVGAVASAVAIAYCDTKSALAIILLSGRGRGDLGAQRPAGRQHGQRGQDRQREEDGPAASPPQVGEADAERRDRASQRGPHRQRTRDGSRVG